MNSHLSLPTDEEETSKWSSIMNKKIVHFFPRLIIGGGTEYLVNFVEGLYKIGVSSEILTSSIDNSGCHHLITRLRKCGHIQLIKFSVISFILSSNFVRMLRIDSNRYSLHFHGIFAMKLGLILRIFGRSVIYQPHGYWRSKRLGANIIDILIDLIAVYFASKIIITSPDETNDLSPLIRRVMQNKTHIVLTRINHLKAPSIKYSPSAKTLICIAVRGVYQKGLDNLFRLMLKAKENCLDLKLVHYYGSQEGEFKILEQQIENANLGKYYELRRAVTDVWSQRLEVLGFLSLSRFEGRSLAVQEAMAYELPILATECAGHIDLLDKTCATLVDPEDLDSQYNGLVAFMSEAAEREAKAETAKSLILNEPSVIDMVNQIYKVHFPSKNQVDT